MAIRDILLTDNPILRRKSKRVSRFDAHVAGLAADLAETMHSANGLGLAAPQIGVLLRVIAVELPKDSEEPNAGKLFIMVNPEIAEAKGEQVGPEGCLSLPGFWANVKRANEVVVKARDPKGRQVRLKANGLLARALQHEIDHLDGILFFDHLSSLQELQPVEKPAAETVGVT